MKTKLILAFLLAYTPVIYADAFKEHIHSCLSEPKLACFNADGLINSILTQCRELDNAKKEVMANCLNEAVADMNHQLGQLVSSQALEMAKLQEQGIVDKKDFEHYLDVLNAWNDYYELSCDSTGIKLFTDFRVPPEKQPTFVAACKLGLLVHRIKDIVR